MTGTATRIALPPRPAHRRRGVQAIIGALTVVALAAALFTTHATQARPTATGQMPAAAQSSPADMTMASTPVMVMAGPAIDTASDSSTCVQHCATAIRGGGHGVAMLCLALMPAIALFARRLFHRFTGHASRRYRHHYRATGTTLGYRAPPRHRPRLSTLGILRI